MCGICGFYSKDTITKEQLEEMNRTMVHRGPDDSGEEIYTAEDGYGVGLAQRRLSIHDLSPMGHQPMHSGDGRISLVFNGEIYNFQALKKELRGYPFRSSCDTEVILAAYVKWGISCLERLNGMFALAIYDREDEKLYLARDRIGKKPLYYLRQGENLMFASELKPLMKYGGFVPHIRRDVLPRFLYHQYLCGPESIFENVYKVKPGQVICFSRGRFKEWQYWDLKQVYLAKKQGRAPTYDEAAHKLRELLREAVRERLAADVPVGAFLSGGYDSSLVTAIAKEVSGQPVRTFSIGFHEEAYNEAKYAKEVAEYLGCDHRELYVDEADMLSMVESIPLYYDEPFADSSQIPSMLVSKLARQEVTVVLSGDGGDELFCGYSIYERVRQAQRLDGVGALAKTVGDAFGLTEKYPFKVRAIAGNRNKETKTQLVNENCRKAALGMVLQSPEGEALPCTYDRESTYRERNWQIRRMLLDMETYLPEDILCKVDRASMMVSLEARCPILDKNVIEYALGLPHVFKYHNGEKKRILKRLAYEYIPRPLLDRPKKGFSVPLDGWLRGPLREQLLSFSEKEYLERQGIFHPVYTAEFVRRYMEKGDGGAGSGENYSRLLWAYLMFQKWNEYWKKEWKQV